MPQLITHICYSNISYGWTTVGDFFTATRVKQTQLLHAQLRFTWETQARAVQRRRIQTWWQPPTSEIVFTSDGPTVHRSRSVLKLRGLVDHTYALLIGFLSKINLGPFGSDKLPNRFLSKILCFKQDFIFTSWNSYVPNVTSMDRCVDLTSLVTEKRGLLGPLHLRDDLRSCSIMFRVVRLVWKQDGPGVGQAGRVGNWWGRFLYPLLVYYSRATSIFRACTSGAK